MFVLAARRNVWKLRFRSGLAYRLVGNDYVLFDTGTSGDWHEGDGRVHFAMDRRGRIYCGYTGPDPIMFHSSLVGGTGTLAAG